MAVIKEPAKAPKATGNLRGAALLLMFSAAAAAQQSAASSQLAHTDLPLAPSAIARPLNLAATPPASDQPGAMQTAIQPGASLTLDQAIAFALTNNTGVKLGNDLERSVAGQQRSAEQALIPNLSFSAYARAQEIDLVALGFKPGAIKIPGVATNAIPTIVKVNTTNAQLSLSQQLDSTALFLYRATEKAREATNWGTLNVRGGAVLQVGGLYLRALADAAMVRNDEALLKQDQLVYEHAKASKDAGVGINLDVLRAQVELQNEQQALENARNAFAKDKIMLNRAMGQPAGQAIELVDAVPYTDFNADSSDQAIQAALAVAFERRKDYRQLQAQLAVAQETSIALKFERLPTVSFGGYYGVLGVIGGLYHGVFTAEGQISIPVFNEAQLRGQKEVAAAQEIGLHQQIDAKKDQIQADIRSSLLDVQSAAAVVKYAQSNVELAQQALDDATLRFTTGVDDNLPVVQAQTTLVGAQVQVVQAEFNYNYAKLTLARNTGVVETQYRTYLGR